MILLVAVILALTSCGSETPQGANTETKSGPSCPSGALQSRDSVNSIHVGTTGTIALSMNGCASTGTVVCHGNGQFTMVIESKATHAIDLSTCQGVGTFECEGSIAGNNVIIYCPTGTPGAANQFNPAMVFNPN